MPRVSEDRDEDTLEAPEGSEPKDAYEGQWYELMKSRDGDTAFPRDLTLDLSTDR